MIDLRCGEALIELQKIEGESINCCVTSPPYWGLRNYGNSEQLGLEETPEEYVKKLVEILMEVSRVLRKDGTLWLNLGDSYANGGCGSRDKERWPKRSRNDHIPKHAKKMTGLKDKNLIGIPWRVAFALQAEGWYLRSDIIWAKRSPMPESIKDRPTRSHEYIFLLAKSKKYYYDHEAVKEPAVGGHGSGNGYKRSSRLTYADKNGARGNDQPCRVTENRNLRDVWTVSATPFKEAHFATFPPKLIRPCILAGCPKDGIVLDPFCGAGTTGLVADSFGRNFIGIDLNEEYIEMSRKRLSQMHI